MNILSRWVEFFVPTCSCYNYGVALMTFKGLRQRAFRTRSKRPIDKEKQWRERERGSLLSPLLVGVRVRFEFRVCQLYACDREGGPRPS